LGVHYPDPFGSDTFCRELVDPKAGEANASGRFRALPEPTTDFSVRRSPAFARELPLNLPSPVVRLKGLLFALPREEDRDPHAKVSSIREEHLGRGREPRLVNQAKLTTAPESESLSTGCSQPVDKDPRLFHPAAWLRADEA
jgi:hypothetical protein